MAADTLVHFNHKVVDCTQNIENTLSIPVLRNEKKAILYYLSLTKLKTQQDRNKTSPRKAYVQKRTHIGTRHVSDLEKQKWFQGQNHKTWHDNKIRVLWLKTHIFAIDSEMWETDRCAKWRRDTNTRAVVKLKSIILRCNEKYAVLPIGYFQRVR